MRIRHLPWAILALTLGAPADADVFRYDGPNGSVAFTDDASRVPPAFADSVQRVTPSDERWTRAERARKPHRWRAPAQRENAWHQRAEAARRGIEDARALEALAHDLRVGRTAARVNAENARRRAERLSDACRRSGACEPGDLRVP